MSIQAQIEVLENLAAVDAELKELREAVNLERQGLDTKRTHLASLEERLARSNKSMADMEKMRGDLTGELRQMGIQVERSREKLSRCRTEREANAAQREIEELRKLYRDREIEVEKIDGIAEQARNEMMQVTTERDALLADLGAIEGDVLGRLAASEGAVKERETVRKELVSKVPAQLYRRYEMIRSRRGTAIASTTDGTCSACHMRLQPMLFQDLTRGNDFTQCPSCNRILYYRPPTSTADSTSGAP
ncbi:MAG TPA: C4-type zinc ribbon domain-containing protein [Polyangiaceae bacterium]